MRTKRKLAAIIMVSCVLCLSACHIALIENTENTKGGAKPGETGTSEQNAPTVDATDATDAPKPNAGSKVVRDEEGLVTITIEDGKAEIEYDLEKWDAMYDMAEYFDWYWFLFDSGSEAVMEKGPFPVSTYMDKVADACVGKTPAGGYYGKYVEPTVIFLMEDGSVEHSPASLAMDNSSMGHHSNPLHWLEGIASLSYESGKDGENTIYAIGKNGKKHDIMVPMTLYTVTSGGEWMVWSAPLLETPSETDEYVGYLVFADEGFVNFEIGTRNKKTAAGYKGSYRIVLAEDDESGYMAGSFVFDLELEWTEGNRSFAGGLPDRLACSYFAELPYMYSGSMRLWHIAGDCLFELDGQRMESYLFEVSYGYDTDEGE
ncbi:MAG: hypothetical protein FWG34_11600 [Oscillospiraceae bacterium]|nr:hypothetical protein [Oscillospiraceae bacterium]